MNTRILDGSLVGRYSSRQRKKGILNFLYVLVARIKLRPAGMGNVRYRAIDYRAVIAAAAIEVTFERP
jgi:hypothetical protein